MEQIVFCSPSTAWLQKSVTLHVSRRENLPPAAFRLLARNRTRFERKWVAAPQNEKSTQKGAFRLWSCYPDSNRGPRPYQGRALPTEP